MPKARTAIVWSLKDSQLFQFLLDKYSDIPEPGSDTTNKTCLNGHALHIFIANESCYTSSTDIISSSFGIPSPETLIKLKRLIYNTLTKHKKNLNRNLGKIKIMCSEIFHQLPSHTVPNPDSNIQTPAVETIQPVNEFIPPALNIKEGLTPREKDLKRRLSLLSESRSEERSRHIQKMKQIKLQINDQPKIIKNFKQSVERKKQTIIKLKKELKKLKTESGKEEIAKLKNRLTATKNKYNHSIIKIKSNYKKELSERDTIIKALQCDKLVLEDKVLQLENINATSLKKDKKTYNVIARLIIYDCISNNVPTKRIPSVIDSLSHRMGILIDSVPDKSSIENCVRELGVISDLQAAEVVMATPGLTLGFDATTQEGVHVNSVHLTTKSNTLVIALDDLSGGTAEDYGNHICQAIQNLAGVYSNFHKTDLHECRDKIIQNISNTMSDRAPVNHATVMRLSELWDKSLTELNCHVHPLDSIAKGCTEALKTLQTEQGKLFGSDCLAGNIVLQLTKMRYKMGTGNPKAFVSFLVKEKLKKGLIPRYRGNRFHVLFHTSGILVLHSEQILDFLGSASALPCGGLTAALLYDLQLQTAKKQLYVMGLIGKLLTGPWMRKFYTSQDDVRNISYYEGVTVIKGVLARVNECLKNPFSIFTRSLDFFDEDLDANDPVLQVLLLCPQDMQVERMLKDCLSSIASVIQRQYESFLCMDESELMKLEAESARSHNMDSEEVVGMFSAEKKRAPSATVCYISSKVRSKKNKTVAYLDSLTESARKERVEWAMGAARIRRRANKVRSSSVNEEIVKRAEQKARESEKRERKQIENLLRKEDFDRIRTEMKDVTEETLTNVVDILSGNIFGRLICHYWFDEGAHCGRIMRVKKEWKGKKVVYNKDVYEVSYWSIEEDESEGVDYDMNKYELACDVLFKDLTLM